MSNRKIFSAYGIAPCILVTCFALLAACSTRRAKLFSKMEPSATGIDFINKNTDTDSLGILDYLYFYNGADVAVGDINNDGLPDLYFASNTNGNKLYLNKGHLQFQDITAAAGVAGHADWTTGVTMADVNGDGLLDIYVCAVGNFDPNYHNRASSLYFTHSVNQLFINNGNNTFTENSARWGLDITGYNTQAVFFDYDKDGDLDMFLLQHSTHQTDSYGPTSLRDKYSSQSGGKLYRNDRQHFTDVTQGSGIHSSALGYGLGVGVADINQDGYDDIYVSNDFHENDYYYVNKGNGTFIESNQQAFGHESRFSMGNDIADINNDGWPDIMTVDMLPEDEKVLKSSLGDEPADLYQYQKTYGYTDQFARNCLQLNTGRGKRFSDIALYSGVAATDWSWGPLIADYDLDGQADIFVANGIKKRPNDLDYIKFISGLQQKGTSSGRMNHDHEMLNHMPSGAWHNYIFQGGKDLKFLDRSEEWGFDRPVLAQGAAYCDLDGDGDLELVTNNMNEPAGIYRNNTREQSPSSHFLTIQLKGPSPNTTGIGTKIFLYSGGHFQFRELQSEKGFMSSSEPLIHFGLGDKPADSLVVLWPNDRHQTILRPVQDQKMIIAYSAGSTQPVTDHPAFVHALLQPELAKIFTDLTAQTGIPYSHKENKSFVDFSIQWLMPHELSISGPKIAVADVNGDGREDFFVGGARGQGGHLFLQQPDAHFFPAADSAVFLEDRNCEDVDAIFFDCNGDGHPDLYVCSGGNEYSGQAPELKDRLYVNDGAGHFAKSSTLPPLFENKSVVCAADYDHDGDIDLFIGGRADARIYGMPPTSYLLNNDGKGNFTVVTTKVTDGLEHIGLVTSAVWTDVQHDGWPDLVVAGEWMPPTLFINTKGTFSRKNLSQEDAALSGWWSALHAADVNGDGFDDLLLGNYGLNSKLTATADYPLKMYVGDVTNNQRISQILAVAKNKKYYPFQNKENLEIQLPDLKKKYLDYGGMAGKTVDEIFGSRLDSCALLQAATLASMVLINDGKGGFAASDLPFPLQWSPVFAFAAMDFDGDGKQDLLAGGNYFGTTPFEGRYDAMPLELYMGTGRGTFRAVMPVPSPLDTCSGEVRSIQPIRLANGKKALIVGFNNAPLKILGYQ